MPEAPTTDYRLPATQLSVSYVGKLKSNGKVFDSSKPGKSFNFVLGAGKVIKGWDQGMKGMKVGGTRILTVPPAMGYGSKVCTLFSQARSLSNPRGPPFAVHPKGCPPDIPGDSTLVFEVKLLSVK